MVKNPPAKQEMKVRSLVQEDLWTKKWQPTSVYAWRIPWTEDSGGLQLMGSTKESDMTELLSNNKLEFIRTVKEEEKQQKRHDACKGFRGLKLPSVRQPCR